MLDYKITQKRTFCGYIGRVTNHQSIFYDKKIILGLPETKYKIHIILQYKYVATYLECVTHIWFYLHQVKEPTPKTPAVGEL